jgi:hypothetical protein
MADRVVTGKTGDRVVCTIRLHMARLRTLVAAGWVMVTIAGSVAVAPAGGAGGPAHIGPVTTAGAIDATGATDVTANLQALIDRTPDGGAVQLESDGDYRVEGTVVVKERHNLRIDGNGARIFAMTATADRNRSQLQIVGGSDLVVSDLEIQGANPHAGLGDRAYVAELEAQHGISLDGVTDVEVDRVHIHDTYGDSVYVSRHVDDRRWSERVWIHDSTFERTGRQGIAVVAARDVVIERNRFADMRRATIDLEPGTPAWGADNIHILDNQVGPGRLLFVAAGGGGPVNRIVVARNALHGRPMDIQVRPPDGDRRQRFWVVDNTSDTQARAAPLRFTRIDGVIVHGNRQRVDEEDAFVQATDSCDVSITENTIAPTARPLEGKTRKCNFIMPVDPPEPPPVAGRGRSTAPGPPATAPPSTAAAPSTAPATTAPTTTEPTGATPPSPTVSPSTTEPSSPATQLAASNQEGRDGVAGPVVVLAMVLSALAGAGGTLAVTARRGRRSAARHRSRRW